MDRGVSIIEATISAAVDGWRLDRALAATVPELSRARIQGLIAAGAVTGRNGAAANASRPTIAGETFAIAVPVPAPLANEAQAIPLVIAYEDEHLIVIDKPAGLVVHPAAGNPDGTLVNALLHHCADQLSGIGGVARPGIVHRIDKDTSGLMVAAKSDRAHEGLARQFQDHSIDRRYLAIVSGTPAPSAATIDAPLARAPQNRKKIAIVAGGRRAVTRYRTIETLLGAALVECRLETGRTHQVRVHMGSIGHPLLGDPLYGRPKRAQKTLLDALGFHRQALHATRLGFIHPVTGGPMAFDSGMPADMQELFSRLHV